MRLSFAALATVLLVAAGALSGCVYRMDIQQGNYLEGKTVDQLQVGMTRAQVRYLLGTPMAPDLFDKDRVNVPESAPTSPYEGPPIQKFPKI